MQVSVRMGDEFVMVDVQQTSKTVWVASGEFEGSTVTVRGSSRRAALNHWRNVAFRQGD